MGLGSLVRAYTLALSELHVFRGSITEAQADAIVSSDDWNVSMGGGVSAAIREAAGEVVALDLAKSIPAELGDVIVTTAGALPARYVFHAVTTSPLMKQYEPTPEETKELISAITRKCVELAKALGVTSIAFPALGTGSAGHDAAVVGRVMGGVLRQALTDSDLSLEVSLWVPSDDRLHPERERFMESMEETPGLTESEMAETPEPETPKRSRLFISYSHEDKRRVNELVKMLQPLIPSGISMWVDTDIRVGDDWRDEIDAALESAKAAVLLVSSSFLSSEFITEVELPRLLAAAEDDGVRVITVHEGPSLWKDTALERFQAANDPEKPLNALRKANREKVLVAICQDVKHAMVD